MSKDSKNQDLDLGALETATGAAEKETKAKKADKEMTSEELEALNGAVDKIKAFGVSDNFSKVLSLVTIWHEKTSEELKNQKAEVIESFGGSEKFKDYVDGEFQTELEVVSGLQKAVSTLNNIKSFYGRREGSKKVKKTQISIQGVYYEVSSDFLASLAGVEASEKRAALLAHGDTVKQDVVEVL